MGGNQQNVMPDINEEMKGFKIEMLFEYPNPVEGGTYLDWAHGTVMDVIVTKTTKKFRIKWAQEILLPLDKEITIEKILRSKWNPKKPVAGAWREFEPKRD